MFEADNPCLDIVGFLGTERTMRSLSLNEIMASREHQVTDDNEPGAGNDQAVEERSKRNHGTF